MVAGVQLLRVLPTHPDDLHALQPAALEAAIAADAAAGLLPCFVCATIGTTNSCAVDPVPAIGALARRHGLWCARLQPGVVAHHGSESSRLRARLLSGRTPSR